MRIGIGIFFGTQKSPTIASSETTMTVDGTVYPDLDGLYEYGGIDSNGYKWWSLDGAVWDGSTLSGDTGAAIYFTGDWVIKSPFFAEHFHATGTPVDPSITEGYFPSVGASGTPTVTRQ